MIHLVHKVRSGIQPQSGYERVGRYRHPETGAIWVLWKTEKAEADVRAEITGDLYIAGSDPDADIIAVYPVLLEHKRARIRAEGEIMLENVKGEYGDGEIRTWPYQSDQAKAYIDWLDGGRVGVEPQLSLLDNFVAERWPAIPDMKEVLCRGIVENGDVFGPAAGIVLGRMYNLLDRVSSAPDLVTALAVDWS